MRSGFNTASRRCWLKLLALPNPDMRWMTLVISSIVERKRENGNDFAKVIVHGEERLVKRRITSVALYYNYM